MSVTALAGGAAAGGLGATTLKLIVMSKLKVTGVSALVLAGIATPVFLQNRSLNRLREENRILQQQSGQLTALMAEKESLAAQLAKFRQERVSSDAQLSELSRLRGEVAAARTLRADNDRLRGENLHLRQSNADSVPPGANLLLIPNPYWRKNEWANKGMATARDAFQTFLWAGANGDEAPLTSLSHPDAKPAGKLFPQRFDRIEGIQIVSQTGNQEDTQAYFKVILENWFPPPDALPGQPRGIVQEIVRYEFEKVDGQWRVRSLTY